ncbi:MAG: TRAP transporter small permease [Candidatus Methylomirabilales bacterium]
MLNSPLIRRLTWLVERLLIGLSAAIAVVVFLQVLFRYLLRQPLFWSEELPRYLLIWMSFLAAAVAQRDEAHINITLVVNRLPARARRLAHLLANGLMLAFLGVLVYSGSLVTRITAAHRSTALQLPMAAVYVALPVGAALMALYLALQILEDLRRLRE